MKEQQFTVSPEGTVTITPQGAVVLDHQAAPFTHERPGYDKKPVQVALHGDLTLQLHGARFSACAKLTADEALGLAQLLIYLAREKLATRSA